ncbi:MAG TPA: 3-hydroxyacyl-CoA dehydrogenase family protein [Chitinophagaceae bacterium]|nr:3-hydroxyacyl-CoA dehydrogenase family protein [Chitinophagaceae bacterium]
MKIAVIANEEQKRELIKQESNTHEWVWLDEPAVLEDVDCFIDLLFDNSKERTHWLKDQDTSIIIVNAVASLPGSLPGNFIRINGWLTFLNNDIMEAATVSEELKKITEDVFQSIDKKVEWVQDQPGFIKARIVSMIINEAYLALEDEVSTKAEIDTAMQLGTSYPYGPFAWAEKIGVRNVYELLSVMAEKDNRYQPADLLKQEAEN